LEWYPGAFYHITARGSRRIEIFRVEIDYELYLRYMGRALRYYKDCYRMYIGNEKEQLINSDCILSYFKNKDRKLYKGYVW